VKKRYRMLIVDDEPSNLKKLKRTFGNEYEIFEASSAIDGFEILKKRKVDVIISDQKMPDMTGIELLKKSKRINPHIVRIVLTGYTESDDLIEAINEGEVHRYITKPWNPDELRIIVRDVLEKVELEKENRILTEKLKLLNERLRAENYILKREVDEFFNEGNIIFKSEEMKKILEMASKIVDVDTTILITGETGTGKELLARYIHNSSKRGKNIFVPVNCGAIPSELAESEFFGYKRGAFSGANRDKKGFFQLADGGTIFLDEIGETPLNIQTKLLRVLQDGEVWPVGSEKPEKVNVRIIAATNRDLKKLVDENKFREDLWYRLNVFRIHIPPLRERREDIEVLFGYFLEKLSKKFNKRIGGVEDGVLKIFKNYFWPGNVRQLQNEVEKLIILLPDGGRITTSMISGEILEGDGEKRGEFFSGGFNLKRELSNFERSLIERALRECNGNRTRAAKMLSITRQSLIQKLKKYGIR